MIGKPIKKYIETFFIISLALFGAVLSSANLFSRLLQAPANTIFVGMTHYYADFYYYLDQFYQGAHGKWLVINNFTSENFGQHLIYFNNVLLGKIGGLLGIESFTTYNLSLVPLKLAYFILCYKFISLVFVKRLRDRICAILLFIFSSSLPLVLTESETGASIIPIDIFRAKTTFFTRFSNMPSLYIENICFIALLIIGYYYVLYIQKSLTSLNINKKILIKHLTKYILPSVLLTSLLTISDPVKTLVYLLILCTSIWFIRPRNISRTFISVTLLPLIIIIASFVIPAFYISVSISGNPIYLYAIKWDYNEYVKQFKMIDIPTLIKSFGLLGIFSILGLTLSVFKKNSLIEKITIVGLFISVLGYFIPYFINISFIPGFRFILISSFLFMAIISINLLTFIEKVFNKHLYIFIVFIYLIVNSITIISSFKKEIEPLKEPEDRFTYLPTDIYQGLLFLRNLKPENAVVLANTGVSTDYLIPGITGKKTFTGHVLMTYNSDEKTQLAKSFYYEWSDISVAKNFLEKNNIKYIIVTKYSFPEHETALIKKYPFLRLLYSNKSISVFTY